MVYTDIQFIVEHGKQGDGPFMCLGFRIESIAYISDVVCMNSLSFTDFSSNSREYLTVFETI
jgi:hypothetical protein